jgi:hypothetical protein
MQPELLVLVRLSALRKGNGPMQPRLKFHPSLYISWNSKAKPYIDYDRFEKQKECLGY